MRGLGYGRFARCRRCSADLDHVRLIHMFNRVERIEHGDAGERVRTRKKHGGRRRARGGDLQLTMPIDNGIQHLSAGINREGDSEDDDGADDPTE